MKQIRVFHADCDAEFRVNLQRYMLNVPDLLYVGCAADGNTAFSEISKTHPDIAVISMILSHSDGFELIRQITGMPERPRIIVVTYMQQVHCIERALSLGCDYYMAKPCSIPLLCERIQDVMRISRPRNEEVPAKPSVTCEGFLNDIGMIGVLYGYRYVRDSIELFRRTPEGSPAKSLYRMVAVKYGATPASVERAIRKAIDVAWGMQETQLRKKLFPDARKPTNTKFIHAVAKELALQEGAHPLDTAALLR